MTPGYDTSLTFGDLILRVAEELGLADYSGSVAAVPSDPGSLDVCKRAVWDGCELFYRGDYVQDGMVRVHRWTFLNPKVTLTLSNDGSAPETVGGDASKYRLPWFVTGRPSSEWSWTQGTSQFTGQARDVSIPQVDRMHGATQTTGWPQLAAVDVLPGAPRQGMYVRFWPTPDAAYVVGAQFPVWPRNMQALNERHLAGQPHDQTVIAASVYAHFRKRRTPDPEKVEVQARFDRAMLGSVAIDKESMATAPAFLRDPSTEQPDFDADDILSNTPIIVNGVTIP